mmetsp:Transcript_262/g.777  ORF Transcript_262/g.777 Transcript_262/m.777 type:complete len:252 (-) Transcript_262:27-782(-)
MVTPGTKLGKPTVFFDLDGTLISGDMHESVWCFVTHLPNTAQRLWKMFFFCVTLPLVGLVSLFSEGGAVSFLCWVAMKGVTKKDCRTAVRLGVTPNLFQRLYPAVMEELEEHQRNGRVVAVLTGNLLPFVTEFCESIGALPIGTGVLSCGEVYTGVVDGKPMVCDEKPVVMLAAAAVQKDSAQGLHAYGNSKHDIAFLSVVGHPYAVRPSQGLRKVSDQNGWSRHLYNPQPRDPKTSCDFVPASGDVACSS